MPCSNGTCQEYLLGGHLELQELGLSTQDVPGGVDLQEPDSRDVGLRTGFMVYSHIDPIGRKLFCCLPSFAFTFRAISRRFYLKPLITVHTNIHTDGRVNHARRQPARREQLG